MESISAKNVLHKMVTAILNRDVAKPSSDFDEFISDPTNEVGSEGHIQKIS